MLPMANILGIDWGQVRIGLAIGNAEQKIALPFEVVSNTSGLIGTLRRIIESEQIYRIVIGIPLRLSGAYSAKAAAVEDFIDLLERHFPLPIIREDERYSSQAADQLCVELEGKYSRDAVAAMLILQGYLDKLG